MKKIEKRVWLYVFAVLTPIFQEEWLLLLSKKSSPVTACVMYRLHQNDGQLTHVPESEQATTRTRIVLQLEHASDAHTHKHYRL
jgi:hypothetical protein